MSRVPVAVSLALFAACASPAAACSTCDAGIRKQVWAGVFDAGFGRNLLYSALPFAVFGIAAAALHGRPGGRR